MAVGKKVILRAIPYWREVGTEKWIQDEEARSIFVLNAAIRFFGRCKCNQCKVKLIWTSFLLAGQKLFHIEPYGIRMKPDAR